jgi:uncharacterized metal-binding protein YceD (DUF177 family)
MTLMPDLKVTNAQVETHFAVEEIFHEKPMGFHLREAVGHLPEGVWKNREQRKKILAYCPDVSIILPMKLERERCDGDNGMSSDSLPYRPAVLLFLFGKYTKK